MSSPNEASGTQVKSWVKCLLAWTIVCDHSMRLHVFKMLTMSSPIAFVESTESHCPDVCEKVAHEHF